MPRHAPPEAVSAKQTQRQKLSFLAQEAQLNKQQSARWLGTMGIAKGAKSRKEAATNPAKSTKKNTAKDNKQPTKEQQQDEEDVTERTDTSYLTSSDEDSVTEPHGKGNTMVTTRGSNNKKRANDEEDLDDAPAKRIAELEKQLKDIKKKQQQQRLPVSVRTDYPVQTQESGVVEEGNVQSAGVMVVHRYSLEEAKANRNKEIMKCVRNATKSQIWRVAKFVKSEKHLDLLTEHVMNYLKVPGTVCGPCKEGTKKWQEVLVERQNFVSTYRDLVRKEINEKRSYTMGQVSNEVEFWQDGRYNNTEQPQQLPTKEEMYRVVMRDVEVTNLDSEEDNIRGTEHLKYVFVWHVRKYLPCVALNEMFGPKYHDWGPVSYLLLDNDEEEKKTKDDKASRPKPRVPPSTEAFALLIYENCYDKWNNIQKWKADPVNKDKPKPRYEKKKNPESIQFKGLYSDPNSGQAKFGGWSQEGLTRFYQLCKLIDTNRQENKERVTAIDEIVVETVADEKVENGEAEKPTKKAKKGGNPGADLIDGADYEEEF